MAEEEGAGVPEVSIVLPCLNEAETLASVLRQIRSAAQESGLAIEVIVADNGSTDGSLEIAAEQGARVVHVEARGYGSALIGGIDAARGRFVVMGDADDSYDFAAIGPLIDKLREGYDLVVGNRFLGGIEPGAMPWKNRWIGNPILSTVGRLFFRPGSATFTAASAPSARTPIAAWICTRPAWSSPARWSSGPRC